MNNNGTATQKNHLIELIADLKEQEAMTVIKDMLASGIEPIQIMDICVQGMREVGSRFERRQYFISALIMAGEIMRQATEIIEINILQRQSDESKGVILLGTIQGDIHDLGKNLFAMLARCEGFEVVDLGVDVAPERFLEEAKRVKPDFVGISCLLTSVLPELKSALELLRKEFPEHHSQVIIGGHCIDEHIFNHVQSDYWADNAVQGLTILKEVLAKKRSNI
jgi:methanogenic corrinoid protein MtbC1